MLPARHPLKPPLRGVVASMAATTTMEIAVTPEEIAEDFAEARTLVKPQKPRHGNGTCTVESIEHARRACIVSRTIRGWCDVCGRKCFPLHMPEHVHGFRCGECCACNTYGRGNHE